MKKWIAGLLVVVTLTILSIYIFIPSKIVISAASMSRAPISAAFRNMASQENWEKWWKDSNGKPHIQGEPYTFNGLSFQVSRTGYNVAGIEIRQDNLVIQSELVFLSGGRDSTWAFWKGNLPGVSNPITRFIYYSKAAEISKDLNAILNNLKEFTSDPQKLYDIPIVRTSFKDTNMLSTRFFTTNYPSTAEVYQKFNLLRKNIQKQHGQISGYPMLNVREIARDSFETQVAIPTSHTLENDGPFFYRKMVPGNFLTANVTGGEYTIKKSMLQMDFYLKDHGKVQMARPFEQLVTDRTSEPDTSKWITRIYLPVVE
jgi:hypothetical protein